MHRRHLLLSGLAWLAACGDPPLQTGHTPKIKIDLLNSGFPGLANSARPGVFNAAVMNLEGGETWYWNPDQPMPLGPCAALPIVCATLGEIDAGRLQASEVLTLNLMDLSPPPSGVADAWPWRSAWSIDALMSAAAAGDNTAMDALTRRIGGPGAVKAWLESKGIHDMHVDRYRREVATQALGVGPFRPAWRGDQAFSAAVAGVAPPKRQAAMQAYLTESRDTGTAQSAMGLLSKLASSGALSLAATGSLARLMQAQDHARGLAQGLPGGARLAQICGMEPGSDGLVLADGALALCTLADGRVYAVAAFLSGSTATDSARADLFARFMSLAVRSFG